MKVRECIRLVESNGWQLVVARGSHRQYQHQVKVGRVTIPGTSEGFAMTHRYAVVIEDAGPNYSAYVPDLPGCVATGHTVDEVEREIREAIELHLDGMKEDGTPIPPPSARAEYVEVAV